MKSLGHYPQVSLEEARDLRFANSRFDPPVIHSSISSRLNILSRGLTKERVVKEVLRELALNEGQAQSGFVDHVPKGELVKLDRAIEPFLNKVFENET